MVKEDEGTGTRKSINVASRREGRGGEESVASTEKEKIDGNGEQLR